MPETQPERDSAARVTDHAEIARLADDLLPALIAKLGASGLGELEVREDGWKVRLRRPAAPSGDGAEARSRRGAERRARGVHAGPAVASAPAPFDPGAPTNGTAPTLAAVGPGRPPARPSDDPTIATSPAVGLYRPRPEARAGTRVRAGDALGSVEVLGIPQEVVAPADGIVGASLVEAGDAVEYGQPLLRIEFAPSGEPAADAAGG